MRKVVLFWWLAAICLFPLTFSSPASAIVIDYHLVSLGGDNFRYEYTITNDGSLGAGVSLELFDILFDPALFDESTLAIVSPIARQAKWDELIFDLGIGIPAAYDAFAMAAVSPKGRPYLALPWSSPGWGPVCQAISRLRFSIRTALNYWKQAVPGSAPFPNPAAWGLRGQV